MGGQPSQNNQLAAPRTGNNSRSGHPKNSQHPEFQPWKKWIFGISLIIFFFSFVVALDQMFSQPLRIFCLPSIKSLAYIGFSLSLLCLIVIRYLFHEHIAYRERLEDPSEIHALIVDAKIVVPRLTKPERPENYAQKKKDVNDEVNRLEEKGEKRRPV